MMKAMAADAIGTKIKKRRQVLRLTQEQLAGRLGVSKSAVANWERGKHFPLRYLGAIEQVLGISLDGEEEPPVIPPDLQRKIDALTPEEQEYVIERLTRRRGAGQAPV